MSAPSFRIHDFEVPELSDTDAAIRFGRTVNPEGRRILLAAHKAMEFASLNAKNLQDRADFATTAQLWREAAETEPLGHII